MSENEYVRMRRFALAVLQSLDQALDLDLFEPAKTEGAAADRSDRSSQDPGTALLELFAYAADQLSAYADQVAAEAQLQKRRRVAIAVSAAAGILVLTAWGRRSRP